MFNLVPMNRWQPATPIQSGDMIPAAMAVPAGKRNLSWQHQPFTEKSGGFFQAALASGTPAGVANLAAGTVPLIVYVSVGGSVAGRYEILYNSVVLFRGYLVANTSYIVPIGGLGFLPSTVTGQTLGVQQFTGGAADVAATIIYAEVVP